MSEREKFTPGPWVVYPVSVNSESCDIVKQDDTNDRISVTCEQSINAGRELANAHLIAAAPELYYENKRASKKLQDVKTFLEANPETEWMTAHWDDSECDGSALLDEVNAQIADLERVSAKARGEA